MSQREAEIREAVAIALSIRGEVTRVLNGVNDPHDPRDVAAYEAICAAATQVYCMNVHTRRTVGV